MDVSKEAITFTTRSYYLITKPGIIMGNAVTTAGGFSLSSRGQFNIPLFLLALTGLCLIIASSCVFNNCIDQEADAKMTRTKNRPLVKGEISPRNAIVFAVLLGIAGSFLLAYFVNLLTLAVALFGFGVYVFLYSSSKYHSVHSTLIGSMAGSIPPVVGYCAVSGRFDLGAFLLFLIMTFWQMPHFFAIGIYRLREYAEASIPILPLKKSILATKIQMYFYIIAFIISCSLLTAFEYTGMGYFIIAGSIGVVWLCLCINGFTCKNDTRWARKMFVFSLVAVMLIHLTIPFSVK